MVDDGCTMNGSMARILSDGDVVMYLGLRTKWRLNISSLSEAGW